MRNWFCLMVICAAISACGGSNTSTTDTGAGDQSQALDTVSPSDTTKDQQAGKDIALADAKQPGTDVQPDIAIWDTVPSDTIVPPKDVTQDTTAPTPDASADISADITPPPGNNIIPNPGFEEWSEELPDHWVGLETNLPLEGLAKFTGTVHGGFNAALLENSSSTHKRFTTAGLSLNPGKIHCTYWVKGKGEIRNAFWDGNDYSNYTSYHSIDGDWTQISYDFSLTRVTEGNFELVFSVRNTDITGGHLVIDDIYCYRDPHPCDTLVCQEWELCDWGSGQCKAKTGLCSNQNDCWSYQSCNQSTHKCDLNPGMCANTADCPVDSDKPLCDTQTHTCIAGDPCAAVVCDSWKSCKPDDGKCHLIPDGCDTSDDCLGDKPVCDPAKHACVSTEDPANYIKNGGFESWSTYQVPHIAGEHELPDYWYGLDIPGSTEISPTQVKEYKTSVHSGASAVQLINPLENLRFTTELNSMPIGKYTCSYRIRGKGSFRHRWYSKAGWGKWVDHFEVDSLDWVRVSWKLNGQFTDFRLIFYPSYTDESKDHLQIDSVLCTKE